MSAAEASFGWRVDLRSAEAERHAIQAAQVAAIRRQALDLRPRPAVGPMPVAAPARVAAAPPLLAPPLVPMVRIPRRPGWSRFRIVQPAFVLHPLSLGVLAGVVASFAIALILPYLGAKTAPPTPVAPAVAEAKAAATPPPTPKPAPAAVARPTDRLQIPSLGLNASVTSIGLIGGVLDTPKTLWQVGRYKDSAAPGAAGTAIIVGHSGAPGQVGVFEHLDRLKPGATITYRYIDGHTATYQVATSAAYPVSDDTAHSFFAPTTDATLNLISCYGHYDAKTGEYDQRWIVTATLVP